MTKFSKNMALALLVVLSLLVFVNLTEQVSHTKKALTFSEFLDHLDKGEVESVVIEGQALSGKLKGEATFQAYAPQGYDLVPNLRARGVQIEVKPDGHSPWYITLLGSWLPILLLIGVWYFFMRQMQVGGSKALSFGKSKANVMMENRIKVRFKDVAGIEEAKADLQEIVDFLKDPKRFTTLGGRLPKGILLVGAPGTGKTLLAKAIAGEANVPFLSISGSDFVEMFVGVGAARVRDLFAQAKKLAPSLVFIDEIDAVGRHRGAGLGGGHDEREQTLNQLLVEMDGFEPNEGVILIAATNRPDVLDPALLRPGRFDRHIVVPKPDIKGREGILRVHIQRIVYDTEVDVGVLARGTPGFAGADLENMVNEAALIAARKGKPKVTMEDFEEAKDKIYMGAERKSLVISEKERKHTAYHEAGHTLVAKLTPASDPVHKVSIIPRGMALGITQQLPEGDTFSKTKEDLLSHICVLLGGRIAEETIFQTLSTGASSDLERVTDVARNMVCKWGMSERLGPLTYGEKEEEVFLGREITRHITYSELTAREIDREIRLIVDDCYSRAKTLITDNLHVLKRIASELLEKETLDSKDIDRILEECRAIASDQIPGVIG